MCGNSRWCFAGALAQGNSCRCFVGVLAQGKFLSMLRWFSEFLREFHTEIFDLGLCNNSSYLRNKSNLLSPLLSFFLTNLVCLFHYTQISCSQTLNYYKLQFLFSNILAIETKPLSKVHFHFFFNRNLRIPRSFSPQIFHRHNVYYIPAKTPWKLQVPWTLPKILNFLRASEKLSSLPQQFFWKFPKASLHSILNLLTILERNFCWNISKQPLLTSSKNKTTSLTILCQSNPLSSTYNPSLKSYV